jgi:hypothetical protein
VTWSFTYGSNPVKEWRDLLSASFTSSCFASNYSFSCCSWAFSSSNFPREKPSPVLQLYALFYDYALHLLQGLGGFFYFFLRVMKARFDRIS